MDNRRQFIIGAAALYTSAAWLAPQRASAQGVSNIIELTGEVMVNGRRLSPDGMVQTGDRVQSGPGSTCGFTIGRDAFLIRPNTDLTLDRGASLFLINGARMVTGAFAAVFGRSDKPRTVFGPTVTAGIRGTGFYMQSHPDATYFCTCFGEIDLSAMSGEQETVRSSRHVARRILAAAPGARRTIMPAPMENHEDAELDRLALLVGQRSPWNQR